jgi:hypothetical protein
MWKETSTQSHLKTFNHFNTIPDEILLNILSQPVLDLKSLASITAVSKRFHSLGLHVIIFNYLRTMQLSTLIDQEGHGQFTTTYDYDAFDEKMMGVTFKSILPISKRYYSSNEAPTLRCASIVYQSNHDMNPARFEAFEPNTNTNSSKKSEKYSNGTPSKLVFRSSKPPTSRIPVIHIRNRKIQGHKQGVHRLLVTRILPFSNYPIHMNTSVAERRFSWEFSYRIKKLENTKHSDAKNEYYFTPLQLTININHLIALESSNEKLNKKIKRWLNDLLHW